MHPGLFLGKIRTPDMLQGFLNLLEAERLPVLTDVLLQCLAIPLPRLAWVPNLIDPKKDPSGLQHAPDLLHQGLLLGL